MYAKIPGNTYISALKNTHTHTHMHMHTLAHTHTHTCRYSQSYAIRMPKYQGTPIFPRSSTHTHTHMHTHTHTHLQILAVTCQETAASKPSAQSFVVIPAPLVLVSMTLGSLTAEQVTVHVAQQIVAAVADCIGVPRLSVELLLFRNARRRLLALFVTCRIFAVDAEEADSIMKRILDADIQVIVWVCGCVCVFWV
jgi:hypothetical protein